MTFLDWLVAEERDEQDAENCPNLGKCDKCMARQILRAQIRKELKILKEEGKYLP